MRRWGLLVAAVVLGAGLVAAAPAGLPSAQGAPAGLPPGFVITGQPSGQAAGNLTDFAFLPDGSAITTGKNGRVSWVSADGGTTRLLATLPVTQEQDLGLVGVEAAADYATSRAIYLARTLPGSPQNWPMQLSRFTVTGDPIPTGLTGEQVLLQTVATADVHAMTGIEVADDGTLWVSVGDGADFRRADRNALRSLDLNDPRGKVLHLNPDGSGVVGNPYYDARNPRAARSLVWASGLRSPFRLTRDETSGTVVLGDVGWQTWEELDVVRAGANLGWPCWEANTATPEYRDMPECAGVPNTAPVHAYQHVPGGDGTSITGGVFYTGEQYPAAYRGAYFFGDYTSAKIWTMRFGADGAVTRGPESAGFGRDLGAPVSFGTAPNGDIVYADISSGTLNRLSYVEGNRAPTAIATTSTTAATRTVQFDGSQSYDLDGHQLTHRWDFGDGTSATGPRVTHQYAAGGPDTVVATLTVTDQLGARDVERIQLAPSDNPPVLTLTPPPSDSRYRVNDVVTAAATASDVEDGPLTVRWRTVKVHCAAELCHDHPTEDPDGAQYARVFDDHGDNTEMRITATATDSRGVSTSRSFVALPDLRTLTLRSNVPASTTIRGVSTATAQVTVGARVSLSASAVASDGVSTFGSWSDGGGRAHEIIVGDAPITLTATYRTAIDQRYETDAAMRTALGAPSGAEQGDAGVRWRQYANGRAYWSAANGVHFVAGVISQKFVALGGHTVVGVPTTDEVATPGKPGAFNDFSTGKSIYWSPNTPASVIEGRIKARWGALGWEQGTLGFPTSDEMVTPSGVGRFNQFQNGSVYWSPATDAWSVQGAILQQWGRTGYEAGPLGYPTTDEGGTPDGRGRFNHFQNASIYWTAATGAHDIRGAIRTRWQQLGWERSYLGYPTSGEFAISGGRRTNFERGYITYTFATGRTTDRRY